MPNQSNFTPEQISEILELFFENLAHRQYIGARYVPIFGRKDESTIIWDGGANAYEPLTIVLYQGNSYTSRQYVPAGIDITDNDFWAETGNYNAQVEQYRQEVLGFDSRIDTLERNFPITQTNIADDAITTDKIADDAVTADKLAFAYPLETGSIADDAITADKLAFAYPLETSSIANGAVTADKIADGAILDIIKDKTFYLTPEMFGAQGGTADDTQAFQAMFDAATDRDVCVLTQRFYTLTDTVTISTPYISFLGLSSSGYAPTVHFVRGDGTFTYGFHVTGQGLTMENININFDDRYSQTYLMFFDAENVDGNINNCCFGHARNHILVKGRNISIHDTLFSSWDGYAIVIDDAQISNMRGYNIYNCRFHSGANCVSTNNVTTYTGIFNLSLVNNMFDGCSYMYYGISDNVTITGNRYFQHSGTSEYPIYFTKTINTSSHITTYVANNMFNDYNAGTRLQGMLSTSNNCSGVFAIQGNFFDSQLTDSHAVIIIRTNTAIAAFVNILSNIIRTSSTGTPVQVITNDSNLTGFIDGNIIKSNSANKITAGSLTVGVNY